MLTEVAYEKEVTGCHFGCISSHSVMHEALDDIYNQGLNLTYEDALQRAKSSLKDVLMGWGWFSDRLRLNDADKDELDNCTEAVWEVMSDDWNEQYQGEDEEYLYEQDGYRISNSPSLVCLFVERSPYYTYTSV